MKYLTRALLFLSLFGSLESFAAYQVRSYHTTCAVDGPVARFFAKPKVEQGAQSGARRKCRDIGLVAHHLDVTVTCKEPYPNKQRKTIFTPVCVDCEAEARFDCH